MQNTSAPSSAPAPTAARRNPLSAIIAVALGAAAIGAFYVWDVMPRLDAKKAMAQTQKDTRPNVVVVPAQRGKANTELSLPGTLLPIQETPIYARTNGYVKHWHTDIGSKVQMGQLLAEIDTPELDRELKQAGAKVQQAQANMAIAKSTADRWQSLLGKGAVSQQAVDEKASAYLAQRADLAAEQANLARLRELKSFQRVSAPFSGIITGRQVEIGQLIAAGNTDPNRWLFKLAKTDTLRIYVSVPQSHVRMVQPNLPVAVTLREFQGKTFDAKIMRTAGALDAQSKTLTTEIHVPNADGALLAGMYAQVKFSLTQADPSILIPANTLIVRADGPQVAAVANDIVQMRKVSLGRDLGTQIEVLSGLNENEMIITNPTDAMRDGLVVKAAVAPPPADKPGEKPAEKPAPKAEKAPAHQVAGKDK